MYGNVYSGRLVARREVRDNKIRLRFRTLQQLAGAFRLTSNARDSGRGERRERMELWRWLGASAFGGMSGCLAPSEWLRSDFTCSASQLHLQTGTWPRNQAVFQRQVCLMKVTDLCKRRCRNGGMEG